MAETTRERRQLAANRRARRNYEILERFEAGMELVGSEVKSARLGKVQLKDSYVEVKDGEAFLVGAHISPYSHRGYSDHEPLRRRKLLLTRPEIRKLIGKTLERGFTLVPVRMYFRRGLVKVLVGVAKGKKTHDKRETIRRREIDRETRAMVKERSR